MSFPHPSAGGATEVRRTPAEVDAAWLTDVLRDRGLLADGARVTGVLPSPVGTGQMADTVRFALDYEPAGAGPRNAWCRYSAAWSCRS